jgi:DNA-binding NarL/FixJ family response regulator
MNLAELTPRERQVLNLLCKGLNTRAVARELGLAYGTVRSHICQIYEKRYVHSRGELIVQELSHRALDTFMEGL